MDAGTEEIIDRFSKSWQETEMFYSNLIDDHPGFNPLIPIYIFIQKLKAAGEAEHFRLGTSVDWLIFSRSVDSALRPEQKYIRIKAMDDSFEVTLRDGNKMYRQYTISDLEDARLTNLLQTLKDTLAD